MVVDSKYVTLGGRYVEVKIEEGPGSWWTLYVDRDIKAQSADHGYIKRQYDSYN